VKIIALSPPAGTGPVVVGKNVSASQREAFRKLFLEMHFESHLTPALKGLMIDRFVIPQPELFENSRRMVQERRARL
jgi:phosphonate transport system substrate-binding protein